MLVLATRQAYGVPTPTPLNLTVFRDRQKKNGRIEKKGLKLALSLKPMDHLIISWASLGLRQSFSKHHATAPSMTIKFCYQQHHFLKATLGVYAGPCRPKHTRK